MSFMLIVCFVGMQEAETTGKVAFEVVDMRRSLPIT